MREPAWYRERAQKDPGRASLIAPTTAIAGWQVAAFYRPALRVGDDFYDFIPLPDGRVMVVIGDVTDKGVPAALVMASTHSLLRAASGD